MNRELDADFDVDAFEHVAVFDRRIEMDRDAAALDRRADGATCARSASTSPFAAGEEMRTEVEREVHAASRSSEELEAAGMQLAAVVDRSRRRLRALLARPA